ncbi:MAG: hypothetical protein ACOWWO_16740 [Peptococcaceae bacterium]
MAIDFYWFNQAVAYWALVLFFIPFKYLKQIFFFAFLGGFVYTWIVQAMAVQVFEFWSFKRDLLSWWDIPLFFVMSWFAVTYLYGYLLYRYPRFQVFILAFFVLWGTLMSYTARLLKKLDMTNWSVLETLMFAVFSHVMLLYVFKFMHKVQDLGVHEDMLELTFGSLLRKKE